MGLRDNMSALYISKGLHRLEKYFKIGGSLE